MRLDTILVGQWEYLYVRLDKEELGSRDMNSSDLTFVFIVRNSLFTCKYTSTMMQHFVYIWWRASAVTSVFLGIFNGNFQSLTHDVRFFHSLFIYNIWKPNGSHCEVSLNVESKSQWPLYALKDALWRIIAEVSFNFLRGWPRNSHWSWALGVQQPFCISPRSPRG